MQLVRDVLSSIEGFRNPDRIESLRGLSNRVFLLSVDGEEYVFRLASANADRLGIDRKAEAQMLHLAAETGLGPEVVRHVFPDGHLITRRIQATPFSDLPVHYREPDTLRVVARAVRRIHALPPIDHVFDPFGRIRASFDRAAEHSVPLSAGSDRILRRLGKIEAARGPLASRDRAFCHNDLFAGNILDAQPIRFVDWEFAGMGDVFFDLATLTLATDESAPLPRKLRSVILDEYFGGVTSEHERRLDDMIFVVRLHVVAWSLTHHVISTPDSNGWPGFTFLGFATELLDGLIAEL